MLFRDMCRAVGIEAKYIENDTHAWNSVRVDGEVYYFDVTWNDAGSYSNDKYS